MATTSLESLAGPLFRVGRRQVFLPNHVLTFIQPKQNQPPNYATFIVPLRFNKLDMRDYLYHAYNVEVISVRSFITAKAIDFSSGHYKAAGRAGQSRRPQPQKRMTVELVKPFVFPEAPEDLSPWDNSVFKAIDDAQNSVLNEQIRVNKTRKMLQPSNKPISQERISIAQQAKRLRQGQETWSNEVNLDEKWTEVEKDVTLSKK